VKSGTGLGKPRTGLISQTVLTDETVAIASSIRSTASTDVFAPAGNTVAGAIVGSDAPSDISQHDETSTLTSFGFGQPVSEQLQDNVPDCRHAATAAPGANARNKTTISNILVERAFKRIASIRNKHTVDFVRSARPASDYVGIQAFLSGSRCFRYFSAHLPRLDA